MDARYIARVLDLTDPDSQRLDGMTLEEARRRLSSGDPESVHKAGMSVRDRAVSEADVHPDDMENFQVDERI